ncbi:MAG: tetratricopeptide repeat protein [Prevotella sp.]|jgi:hypothetical protein|nr:tetratricopeptide repeat protein [Prevotella sp.]
MMKKIVFITLFAFIAVGLFAQKGVRKAVRTGNKAYNEQRYGAAETEYVNALKENASSKEASFNLSNTYYKQQRWDDAEKEYRHYLTLENEDETKTGAAWSNMGNTFLKKKGSEKARQMQAAQGQQPQQSGQQADNLKLSMEAYKNALRLNPGDEETRYNLAVVQKMIKDKENQDQNQDKDQKKDQNKDQKQDQNKDQKQDPRQDKQDQKQDEQDRNQMSRENMQQILQAIEQDEKDTQERVKQAKVQERKQKNENNRKQNKDW